jgi:ElaB/YqjD/DUF883 family membrane-anchored ribosome-binding protein
MNKQKESTNGYRSALTDALERGREIAGDVRNKAVEGAKVADQKVRESPYQSIAIGIGLGFSIGYLLGRRYFRSSD